ncbi:MAG: hypothetical protein K2X26_10985 [Chitinophagaceae bacterium]|jgi:hypothetical protein|nr:hypothetical protein [Chitinophagaceae bacterium]MCA6439297.1 hypothetical protein [Chitinophagaceae bacterium]MCA6446703.1 hypothetical protein [Chitinophagaceae bacterium]
MEEKLVNIDPKRVGLIVANYVRARAIKFGTFITYEENGKVIRENPRTGEKIVLLDRLAKRE